MPAITWSFCYDGDWFTYAMAWMLLYPYVVWGGFFIAGFIFSSPILLYVSKISSITTVLLTWGLQQLLKIPRPPLQDCESSLAVPDQRLIIAIVNVFTVIGIVTVTRKNIHPFVLIFFIGATLLYFVAVNTNHYLSPIQFCLSFGLALSFSGFWIASYVLLARPILISYGYHDISQLGFERVEPLPPAKRFPLSFPVGTKDLSEA